MVGWGRIGLGGEEAVPGTPGPGPVPTRRRAQIGGSLTLLGTSEGIWAMASGSRAKKRKRSASFSQPRSAPEEASAEQAATLTECLCVDKCV